jgi:superfamily I DNA/RNA helicase
MSPLPSPRGNQHKVIFLSADRHHVVLGTAGTGKSTMAMLRADHLARPSTPNSGPVLVVTYNGTLVNYLQYLAPASRSGITIETYGKFARGYLASIGKMGYNQIVGPDGVRGYVAQAIVAIRGAGHTHAVLGRDLDWMIDEIHWITGMGISTLADYQAIERVGRQTPLGRGPARDAVWAVRETYRAFRTTGGYPYDWYDIATVAKDELATDTRPRRYKHIIIDEGQDLSPEAIRSLVAAVDPGGSLTFFGDYHQAIYGQGLSWQSSGIDLRGRQVERFADNLRNTAQIANVAIAMTQSPYMTSNDLDLVLPRAPRAAGPMPTLVTCADPVAEADYLRDLARDAGQDQSVAILARTWAEARKASYGLQYTPLKESMGRWDEKPGIYVGAYHSAKGLEFDAVLLPFLNDASLPLPDVLHAYDATEACAREARLLYVGITRARVTLVMSHSGKLTRLLPANPGLWTQETA